MKSSGIKMINDHHAMDRSMITIVTISVAMMEESLIMRSPIGVVSDMFQISIRMCDTQLNLICMNFGRAVV